MHHQLNSSLLINYPDMIEPAGGEFLCMYVGTCRVGHPTHLYSTPCSNSPYLSELNTRPNVPYACGLTSGPAGRCSNSGTCSSLSACVNHGFSLGKHLLTNMGYVAKHIVPVVLCCRAGSCFDRVLGTPGSSSWGWGHWEARACVV